MSVLIPTRTYRRSWAMLLHGKNADRPTGPVEDARFAVVAGATPLAELRPRQPARVAGRIRAVRIQPWSGTPALECTLVDASGAELTLVFLGRREIAGRRTGTKLIAEGMVGERRSKLAILNPAYQFLAVAEPEASGE